MHYIHFYFIYCKLINKEGAYFGGHYMSEQIWMSNTVFDPVQSPLCLVPLWIWKNLGLWKKFQQKIYEKICLRTYLELNLFFCFSYLNVMQNNKTILLSLFWKKSYKIKKIKKIKITVVLDHLTNLGKCRSFRGD